ncbi:pentapeptide repeat-containing protein [Nostoc sp. XA010]|uniref:pentapeptide repeat-containing protein n=1 Tax=Nostoc sp. XA010 TaxID=2780407 RepID=UPI0035A8984B|nr:pentapeptide repeat-containing protein [Nostoc sp. XA010]
MFRSASRLLCETLRERDRHCSPCSLPPAPPPLRLSSIVTWDGLGFFDCDLRGATSTYANLTSAHFTRVNLQGAKLGGSGEDPCEYWDVIRHDGVFVPGFTSNLYIAESKTKGDYVF